MSYKDVFDACKYAYYETEVGFNCKERGLGINPYIECKSCKDFIDEAASDIIGDKHIIVEYFNCSDCKNEYLCRDDDEEFVLGTWCSHYDVIEK